MADNFPRAVRIKKIIQETPLVRSYVFEYPYRAKPGQFVNLWLPGVDEKPMSIAFDDGKFYTLAIAAVGGMTRELAKLKTGDHIGIRGPYGTNFTWQAGERIAMLAGGYGAAPLYFAACLASKDGCCIDFFHGARTKEYLMFANRVKKLKNTVYLPAADDGSGGCFKGTAVDCWMQKIEKGIKYGRVMTCGPELMMKKVSDIAWKRKIKAEIAIERYMKCGLGICGNCCVDDLGITMCQNGPVMSNDRAREIKEFGLYHREDLGQKHYL